MYAAILYHQSSDSLKQWVGYSPLVQATPTSIFFPGQGNLIVVGTYETEEAMLAAKATDEASLLQIGRDYNP